jgi:hypothetical protein
VDESPKVVTGFNGGLRHWGAETSPVRGAVSGGGQRHWWRLDGTSGEGWQI